MQIHSGFSEDGIRWTITSRPITFVNTTTDPEVVLKGYAYDPRVCWIEDRYYVTWCNGYYGPTIGLAWTKDFARAKSFGIG